MKKLSICLFCITTVLFFFVVPLYASNQNAMVNSSVSLMPTLTIAPDETIKKFEAFVIDENCTLPCWWSLELGKSTEQEVKVFFEEYFAVEDYSIHERENFVIHSGSRTVALESDVGGFIEEPPGFYQFFLTAIINNTTHTLEGISLLIPGPNFHQLDWSGYSIANILATYGNPDEITFSQPITFSSQRGSLILRYHSIGLYLRYELIIQNIIIDRDPMNVKYTICNDLDYVRDFIEIWIQTDDLNFPRESGSWDSLRFGSDIQRHIEDITSYTVDEFSEILSNENTCITSNETSEWN